MSAGNSTSPPAPDDEPPDYELLPSEYFRRQIYGCFWFERQGALDAIAQYPDNILFESDYPHPTCQHPGPRTPGMSPRPRASPKAICAGPRFAWAPATLASA